MGEAARHLVFDVGGTQLRAAIWDADAGRLSAVHALEAPSHVRHPQLSETALRSRLIGEMSSLRERIDPGCQIRSIAVAFPGPVDPDRRIVAAPTLWGALGRYPYDLGGELAGRWPGARIRIMNDVSAAGFRYWSELEDPFCIVTVSTGIGSKVFAGGRPLVGASGTGGEIGHLQIDPAPDSAACDCGGRGHLGAYASGRGLAARAREAAERDPGEFRRSLLARERGIEPATVTAEAVALAYRRQDPWATGQVARGAEALGGVLAAVRMAVGVDRFIVIGGFAIGLGPRFADAVREKVEARCGVSAGGSVASVTLGEADGQCALVGAGRAAALEPRR